MTTPELPSDFTKQAQRMAAWMKIVRESPYIPLEPTKKQWAFLLTNQRSVLFGGAAGGGKTICMMMAALMFVDDPKYRALILRRTFPELKMPGAPMDVAEQWLMPTDAKRRDQGKEWTFPSGAKIMFGYMETDKDMSRYQSARYDFIGYDEASHFTEKQLTYLFSRLRQDVGSTIPLRHRLCSNPGGTSHQYLLDTYVFPETPDQDKIFIPSLPTDNPHLDQEEYAKMLGELDPVTRRQLQEGDWLIQPKGNFFTNDFGPVKESESRGEWDKKRIQRARAWDLAATETGDYCVGLLLARDKKNHIWRVEDVVRVKAEPKKLERLLKRTAQKDGPGIPQIVEEQPGAAGKMVMRDLKYRVFEGYPVYKSSATGSKEHRARLAAAIVADGDLELAPGKWNSEFTTELLIFPADDRSTNDDQVDALAHAVHWMVKNGGNHRPNTEQKPKTSLTTPMEAVHNKKKQLPQTAMRIYR